MKVKRNSQTSLILNRETLRDLNQLQQVAGGVSKGASSCYPLICETTTVQTSTCG